ncbi:MAG: hypothetical protein HRT77_16025, partial [Halioglobus sp.]|nr:hypothetical protein [Halioglobus sp.]
MTTLNILMVQMNTRVGDFEGNARQVIDAVTRAELAHEAPVVAIRLVGPAVERANEAACRALPSGHRR